MDVGARRSGVTESLLGQERALNAADAVVKIALWAAIEIVVTSRPTFTSDHVWEEYRAKDGPEVREPRVLGPLLCKAVKQGLCRPTGKAKSGRPERHTGDVTVYESVQLSGPQDYVVKIPHGMVARLHKAQKDYSSTQTILVPGMGNGAEAALQGALRVLLEHVLSAVATS